MALPMDYRAIRVWHVRGDLPGNWRELQKRAWREGAPVDALYVDYAGVDRCPRFGGRSLDSCGAGQRPRALPAGVLAGSGGEINAAGPPDEGMLCVRLSAAVKRELADYGGNAALVEQASQEGSHFPQSLPFSPLTAWQDSRCR